MPGFGPTFDEFKHGTLHSGSKTGPKVTNRKQAIAIAMSEDARKKSDPQSQIPHAMAGLKKVIGK